MNRDALSKPMPAWPKMPGSRRCVRAYPSMRPGTTTTGAGSFSKKTRPNASSWTCSLSPRPPKSGHVPAPIRRVAWIRSTDASRSSCRTHDFFEVLCRSGRHRTAAPGASCPPTRGSTRPCWATRNKHGWTRLCASRPICGSSSPVSRGFPMITDSRNGPTFRPSASGFSSLSVTRA